jgi:2-oxoglutarate dehydrogenase E2 component (dihydrolipoamide succinyltransferase)
MSIEIRVPALPESIADATLVAWHKQPGEAFKRDENLADLETDKVVLEVPAPADGVMGEHKFAVGATVTEGQVLAQLEASAAPAAPAKPATAPAAAPAAPAAPACDAWWRRTRSTPRRLRGPGGMAA